MGFAVRTGKPPDSGERVSLARRGRGRLSQHKTAGCLLGERRSRGRLDGALVNLRTTPRVMRRHIKDRDSAHRPWQNSRSS
jgi:hypothetical protein